MPVLLDGPFEIFGTPGNLRTHSREETLGGCRRRGALGRGWRSCSLRPVGSTARSSPAGINIGRISGKDLPTGREGAGLRDDKGSHVGILEHVLVVPRSSAPVVRECAQPHARVGHGEDRRMRRLHDADLRKQRRIVAPWNRAVEFVFHPYPGWLAPL
jgi:hypothetical protein